MSSDMATHSKVRSRRIIENAGVATGENLICPDKSMPIKALSVSIITGRTASSSSHLAER